MKTKTNENNNSSKPKEVSKTKKTTTKSVKKPKPAPKKEEIKVVEKPQEELKKEETKVNEEPVEASKNEEPVVQEKKEESLEREEKNVDTPLDGKKRPKKMSKRKARKLRFLSITKENDIKYSGPLSYRYLRIVGWFLFAFAQVGIVLTFGAAMNTDFDANTRVFRDICSVFGTYMMPLFLIAAFSVILRERDSFKRPLLMYGGLSLLVIGAYFLVYEHYIVGLIRVAVPAEEAHILANSVLEAFTAGHPFAFNIFIDLFLCVLFYVFLNYKPRKVKFFKEHVIVFRLFAILPILYEIASLVFKFLGSSDIIDIPHFTYPLFTTKPPLMFLLFVFLVLYIKNRERIFLKKGFTHEQYTAFLKTHFNSLDFSKHLMFLVIIFSILDFVIALFGVIGLTAAEYSDGAQIDALIAYNLKRMSALGFGLTAPMIFISPILLLFNYNKTHENKTMDIVIPLAGIALVAFVYIEGIFQVLIHMPEIIGG